MIKLIVAAIAAVTLSGCVAVADPYYYPAPAVGVGIYSAPVYYHGYHHRHHHRHHHRGHRHWR